MLTQWTYSALAAGKENAQKTRQIMCGDRSRKIRRICCCNSQQVTRPALAEGQEEASELKLVKSCVGEFAAATQSDLGLALTGHGVTNVGIKEIPDPMGYLKRDQGKRPDHPLFSDLMHNM